MARSKIAYCLVCGNKIPEERLRTGKARYCSSQCCVNSYKARKRIRVYEEDREFIGWFCGEGYITIRKSKPRQKKYIQYAPVVGVTLRDDDFEIISWAKNRFGGWIYRSPSRKITGTNGGDYIQNPTANWKLSDLDKLEKLLQILVEAKIPAKKINEAKVLREFVKLKLDWLRDHWPREKFFPSEMIEKFEGYYTKLREMKKYHG